MKEIIVHSKQTVMTVSFDVPHAYIQISSPDDVFPNLNVNEHTADVLQIKFHDSDNYSQNGIILFDTDTANSILTFVERYKDEIETLIVHCEAGISRSAGVAAALGKVYFKDDMFIFSKPRYKPNMRVYELIRYMAFDRNLFEF